MHSEHAARLCRRQSCPRNQTVHQQIPTGFHDPVFSFALLISALKKVNIGQLSETLQPAIEKAGYTELNIDKPEIGKDVYIGFSCLGSKSDRSDYDSRNTLKKTVNKVMADTNWRMMSDGIHYRLGYLSERLRAYEREEDLLKLVKHTR